MKPEEKELFRAALLRVMDANRTRFGMTSVALAFHLASFGFTPAVCGGEQKFHELVLDEIGYLADKGMLEEVTKTLSRENRAWRITAAGIAFVDERG